MLYSSITTGNGQGMFIPSFGDTGNYIVLSYTVCNGTQINYDNNTCANGTLGQFYFNSTAAAYSNGVYGPVKWTISGSQINVVMAN